MTHYHAISSKNILVCGKLFSHPYFSGYELFSICQPPILKYQPEVRLFIPENHHPEVRLFIPEDQTSRRLKA
jgi:hypothetical protein